MILEIVQLGDPVLRRKAHKISQIDRDIRLLADDLAETLNDSDNGVGLAAPQVGESVRMLAVEYPEDDTIEDAPYKTWVVLNPEITWHSTETNVACEGCLSVPGLIGKVERYDEIKIKGLSKFGRPMRISAKGFLARIFQHEIDHLDGICFIDRATEIFEQKETDEEAPEETEANGTSDESSVSAESTESAKRSPVVESAISIQPNVSAKASVLAETSTSAKPVAFDEPAQKSTPDSTPAQTMANSSSI